MKYKKHIIRVIFMFVMVVGIFVPLEGKAEETKNLTIHMEGKRDYDFAYKVFELVNQERAKVGVEPLALDVDLMESAMVRSGETSVYWSHTRPNNTMCFSICDKMHGENIAAGQATPEAVMERWMNSPGHKANILDAYFRSIGIGCVWNGKVCYWVQCFGCEDAEGTEDVQTSGTKEIKQEISINRNNLEIYAYSVANSVSGDKMFIGETGYLVYGLENQTGFSYNVGVLEDFQFSSDNPDVVSIDEEGKFTVKSEGVATIRVALKADPTIEWTKQIETKQQDLSDTQYAYVSNIYTQYTYNGSEIMPVPKVYHSIYDTENNQIGSVLLEEGTDYTLTYENNLNAGTARVLITGKGKYKGTRTCEFEIAKAYQSNCRIYGYIGVYDKVSHGICIEGAEEGSTIEYSTNNYTWTETPIEKTDVGLTTVYYRITNPNYETISGSREINIISKLIDTCTFSQVADATYNGNALCPEVIVSDGETILQKGIDYELEYKNNTEAGNAEIIVSGLNQYTGTKTIPFSIIRDVSTLEYDEIPVQLYKEYGAKPSLTIKDGNKTLTREIDYNLEFQNYLEPGMATVVITGKGFYSGTKTLEYHIQKELSMVIVTSGWETQIYTGSQICPKVTLYDKTNQMQEGTDYTVTYGENINLGTGTIRIEGVGNYTGESEIFFEIVKNESQNETDFSEQEQQTGSSTTTNGSTSGEKDGGSSPNTTDESKSEDTTEKIYNATEQTGSTTEKTDNTTEQTGSTTEQTGTTTEKADDITENISSAEVELQKVAKVKSLKAITKAKNIVLKWKKVKEIHGYQIEISTNSNFKNPVKITVGKTKTKYTLKNQKAGMKYYIRIRAYRKYTAEDGTSKKIFGKWISVNIKK